MIKKLEELDILELVNLIQDAQEILRLKKIEALKKEPCNCDRYTCIRCRELYNLGS